MKENYPAEPQYLEEEYEEIDLAGLARKLLREWKLVLKWCCVAAVVGGGFDTYNLPSYTAMQNGEISIEIKGGITGYVY